MEFYGGGVAMKGRILLIANNIYAISLFNVKNNIPFSYLDKINNKNNS